MAFNGDFFTKVTELPQEIKDEILLALLLVCLLPGRIFLDPYGRLLSTNRYATHAKAAKFVRPFPNIMLALNRGTLRLAKEILFARNTWVVTKMHHRVGFNLFDAFEHEWLLRIQSVVIELPRVDASWAPRTPGPVGSQPSLRWIQWKGQLGITWARQFDFFMRKMPHVDHVIVDVSQAYDRSGRSIADVTLGAICQWLGKIARTVPNLGAPPHLRYEYGDSEHDKESLEGELEEIYRDTRATIRHPCTFCEMLARDDLARLLLRFLPTKSHDGTMGKKR